VENKDLAAKDFRDELVFNRDHSLGRVYKVIPNKLMKTLMMRWVTPASTVFDQKKSSRYLAHVIGHEGPNSLLSFLVEENLAEGLSAGSSSRVNQAFDQFTINIALTEKGEQQYERVMEEVYKYINEIRAQGPVDYIYEEYKKSQQIEFDNLSKSSALGYGNMLCRRLNFIQEGDELRDILYAPYNFSFYDK
jgi:insulysin